MQQTWRHKPAATVIRRLRQEDKEFETRWTTQCISEMTRHLSAIPGNLGLISRTQIEMEGRNQLHRLSSGLQVCVVGHAHPQQYTQ